MVIHEHSPLNSSLTMNVISSVLGSNASAIPDTVVRVLFTPCH